MKTTNNEELELLTIEQLEELFVLFGKIAKIVNPGRQKLSILKDLGKDFSLSVDSLRIKIFREIVKRD